MRKPCLLTELSPVTGLSECVEDPSHEWCQRAFCDDWDEDPKSTGRPWGTLEPMPAIDWTVKDTPLAWKEALAATREAWERLVRSRRGQLPPGRKP